MRESFLAWLRKMGFESADGSESVMHQYNGVDDLGADDMAA